MDEQRVKHLELVQAVITRMANNSFLLKGWSVTLVAGLFAFASKDSDPWFLAIAWVPCVCFAGLDAYYLSLERRFRACYVDIAATQAGPVDFSLKPAARSTKTSFWSACKSPATSVFHGAVFLSIVVAMITACLSAPMEKPDVQSVSN